MNITKIKEGKIKEAYAFDCYHILLRFKDSISENVGSRKISCPVKEF